MVEYSDGGVKVSCVVMVKSSDDGVKSSRGQLHCSGKI